MIDPPKDAGRTLLKKPKTRGLISPAVV